MRIDLEYNNTSLCINPPDGVAVDVYAPAKTEPINDGALCDILLNAGAPEYLANSPLLVVNDGHRNTPTAKILSLLKSIIPQALDKTRFVVAAGSHEQPSDQHLEKIFGSHLNQVKDRVSIHSAHDSSLCATIGKDHFGESVMLNREVAEADQICVISSVEPHYFAGFTGGRKSFLPGLTDLATIERNHNMASSLKAQPLALEGNPVAEHMAEMLEIIDTDRIFSIQVVINSDHEIVGLFAGDIQASFHEAVRLASEVFSYQAEEPYDMVIAELRPPLDGNLYQAQKALENCQAAVKEGGACVVVSACSDGIGSPHFYELADNWDRVTNAPLNGPPKFGSHKLSRVNQLSKKIMVGLKSELDASVIKHVFYEPILDIDELIKVRSGEIDNFRIAIVKDAGNQVLRINKQ